MKRWYPGLEPRERTILLGGAAVAVVVLLWAFVLRAAAHRSVQLRDAVAMQQRLLVDLARVDGSQLRATARTGPGEQTLMS